MNPTEAKPFPENLTPRQREVLVAYVMTGSHKAAGTLAGCDISTVHSHLQAARQKAHAKNGVQLVVAFIRATEVPKLKLRYFVGGAKTPKAERK